MGEDSRAGIARWAGRCPCWVVGGVLALLVVAIDHFDLLNLIPWWKYSAAKSVTLDLLFLLPLFLPGAIKRWTLWHVMVMLLLAVTAFGINWVLVSWHVPGLGYKWFWDVYVTFAPIALVGLGEIFLRRRISVRNAAWVVTAAITVAAVYILVYMLMWLMSWTIQCPGRYGLRDTYVWNLAGLPMEVVLVWVAIPTYLALAERSALAGKAIVGGLCAAVLGSLAIFAEVTSFQLARESLVSGKPFDRHTSASWLIQGGKEEDSELMWKIVDQGEWTDPTMSDTANGPSAYWRQSIISALAKRDSARLAERLSGALRLHPSVIIAKDAAMWMAQHKRYETVPLLMRYALAETNEACTDALVEMKLPCAALPVMRAPLVWAARISGRTPQQYEASVCATLKGLLGKDAGTDVNAWYKMYYEVAPSVPTPLPRSIKEETERVIQAMLRYFDLAEKWAGFCLGQVKRAGLSGEQGYKEWGRLTRCVAKPNWNVVTTDDLEHEIDAYERRVESAIKESQTSTTGRTATTATSNP